MKKILKSKAGIGSAFLLFAFVLQFIPGLESVALGIAALGAGNVYQTGPITTQSVPSENIMPQVHKQLIRCMPWRAPLVSMLTFMKAGKIGIRDNNYRWFIKRKMPVQDVTTAALTVDGLDPTIVEIPVANNPQWCKHDIVHLLDDNGYSHHLRVLEVLPGVVIRARAFEENGWTLGPTDPQLPSGSRLLRLAPAYPEKSCDTCCKFEVPCPEYNYSQIFKDCVCISRTAQKRQNWYSPTDWVNALRDMNERLLLNLEASFLFGQRSYLTDPVTGQTVTTMHGMDSFIQTNVMTYPIGGMTYNFLFDVAEQVFCGTSCSGEKYVFAGCKLMTEIDKILITGSNTGYVKYESSFTRNMLKIGLKITGIETRYGALNFVYDPAFDFFGKDYYAQVLDLSDIRLLVHTPFFKTTRGYKETGCDGTEVSVIGEYSSAMWCEECHGKILGI